MYVRRRTELVESEGENRSCVSQSDPLRLQTLARSQRFSINRTGLRRLPGSKTVRPIGPGLAYMRTTIEAVSTVPRLCGRPAFAALGDFIRQCAEHVIRLVMIGSINPSSRS